MSKHKGRYTLSAKYLKGVSPAAIKESARKETALAKKYKRYNRYDS